MTPGEGRRRARARVAAGRRTILFPDMLNPDYGAPCGCADCLLRGNAGGDRAARVAAYKASLQRTFAERYSELP